MESFETLVRDYAPAGKAAPAPQAAPQAAVSAPEAGKGRRRGKRPLAVKPRAAEPAPAPPPAEPDEEPVFVGGKPRSAEFPLECPIAYQGRVYDTVVLRRPTAAEVAAFFDALAESGFRGLPVFYTPDGTPIPHKVIERLDPDDDDRIGARIMDFLPRRMLPPAVTDGSESTPASGETTGPTSSA